MMLSKILRKVLPDSAISPRGQDTALIILPVTEQAYDNYLLVEVADGEYKVTLYKAVQMNEADLKVFVALLGGG